jgi:plasmid stabilization system protein ParE
MARVVVRPGALREINQQLEYLQAQAGLETVERFLEHLMISVDELADMPRLGPLCGFRRASLQARAAVAGQRLCQLAHFLPAAAGWHRDTSRNAWGA